MPTLQRRCLHTWCALLMFSVCAIATADVPADPEFETHIEPILRELCFDCHGDGAAEGGVQFDAAESVEVLIADRSLWGKVWDNVLTETMPPADMPQPTDGQRRTLSRWIGQTPFGMDDASSDPGRVTIRRLNRQEYRYAVKDLLGIDFDVEEHFPADDTGYGFDTIGDVLTVPPTLLDKYFSAAETIVERLLVDAAKPASERSESFEMVFVDGPPPADREGQNGYAREILARFATRAFRRPPEDTMVEKLLSLTTAELDEQSTFEEAVGQAIVAVLVSPRFINRAEYQPRPDDPKMVHPLDEYALASRLSFFLWSSIPDRELMDLAAAGRLRAEVPAQFKRMLASEKSQRMVRSFVGQWLQIDNIVGVHKQGELNDAIRHVRRLMRKETEMLFAHILHDDRDAMELLTADYTFLNERLANFYEIADVEGEPLRLAQLPEGGVRGGVLTHGSVLTVTSNPGRTSPVKRGRFILDNIVGTPSPPAPDEVPPLEQASQGIDKQLTLRAQLELHRANPDCASCHDRMDPLGLALENFDAIGRWRDDENGLPIDASGELVSGEQFTGIRELREILAGKPRLFHRCLTRKLMTYALGRGIEYTDTPAIEAIVDRVIAAEGSMQTMLLGIVESPQFQLRRGDVNDNE